MTQVHSIDGAGKPIQYGSPTSADAIQRCVRVYCGFSAMFQFRLARTPPMTRATLSKLRAESMGTECVQASSPIGLTFLGGPISAGWNKIAAAKVQTSDKASSFPILDVPGCLDSQRLPKAAAVVKALKNTARVRFDCKRFVVPARHAITK